MRLSITFWICRVANGIEMKPVRMTGSLFTYICNLLQIINLKSDLLELICFKMILKISN